MPIREAHHVWTFTSTNSTAAWATVDNAREVSFYINTAAGSTATVILQSAADSTSFAVNLGSTSHNLGASSGVLVQFTGPFGLVRPRVSDITSTGTVVVHLFGN